MRVETDTSNILRRVVAGDVKSLSLLSDREISEASKAKNSFCLEAQVLRNVLMEWKQGLFTDDEVQRWASFIRRGYLESTDSTPVRPVHIDYQESREDAIVEIIGRLDEIGDFIDGYVSDDEVV